MARMARAVAPGLPHHVTQRGNRRQETFFEDGDYLEYMGLMAEWCGRHGVSIWAWCFMPNHVHLIAVPSTSDGLARAVGEAHRRYTRHVNFREGWRGYLWQGRFASFVMDEPYLAAAVRYVEMNPVRAGLVKKAGDYKWSSAAGHLSGLGDSLCDARPLLDIFGPWDKFLRGKEDTGTVEKLRLHSRTGRPLGDDKFVKKLEKRLGRTLSPKPGGRPKNKKG